MKRILIVVGLVVVVAAGGYFAYRWHQQIELIKAITPHVKNTSLRTSNALSYETSEDSKITYKELFEKLEADILEIDKRILDVQTVSTPATQVKTDVVVSYLKGCQELLRAQLAKYRKRLAMDSTGRWLQKSTSLAGETSYYGRDFAVKTLR